MAVNADYIRLRGDDAPGYNAGQLTWLQTKYRGLKFDAIVVVGFPALEAVSLMRDRLWPGVPVLFCLIDPVNYQRIGRLPNSAGVLMNYASPRTVVTALKILQETKNFALVGGSAPADLFYNSSTAETVKANFPALKFIDLTNLDMDILKRRLATLPPHTFVLLGSFFFDRLGQPVLTRDLVPILSGVANAPLFDSSDFGFGLGITGGALQHSDDTGLEVARLALRVLHGEKADSIPVTKSPAAGLRFDWRQLRKWNIPESRLPAGSKVEFRQYSMWEKYRWWIVLIVLAIVVEALLIAKLLFERRRGTRAELQVRRSRDQITHLNRVGSLGQLAASLAHELNQPLAGILSNAQAASRFLSQREPNLTEVGEALQEIQADDVRASQIIRKMREMLRTGSVEMTRLDLNAVAADAVALLRTDAKLRKVEVALNLTSEDIVVNGDSVQLQQVILNLVLNAMEAMASNPPEHRQVVVQTSRPKDRQVAELAVTDHGSGIQPELRERIFEPFFSSRKGGLGMGLSISRSIADAHGGRIDAKSSSGAGTTFRLELPLAVAMRGQPV